MIPDIGPCDGMLGMDYVWRTLNHAQESGRWQNHPLSALIPKAKANISERKAESLERFRRGDVDFEGLLMEEWQTLDVQEELRAVIDYGSTEFERKNGHRELQKKVYDRVRKRFPDPKPRVSSKGRWRKSLSPPNGDSGS